jgi:hypothetical protein
MKIQIISNFANYESIISNSTIKQALKANLEIEPTTNRDLRGADPAIAIAIVSAASGALGILLSGLLELIKGKHGGKISIQSENSRIEIPANYPPEKLDILIDKVKELDIEKIKILRA